MRIHGQRRGATAAFDIAPLSITIVFIAAGMFGATYIALTDVALLWATRRHPDRPAFGVGASFLMIAVGQAVGAPMTGPVVDAIGLPAAFYGCAAIALIGAAIPMVTSAPSGSPSA